MSVALHDPRETTLVVREGLLPSRRMRPSEAAAAYLRNEKGPWDPSSAPMMIEPLDLLASRQYQGIIYVGPARTGKTFSLIHGGITYAVCCSPGDMLVTQMSQDAARDFSRTEVDRVIRYSPELLDRMSRRPRDDNTFDKFFRSGVSLKLGWPAISQLSSKTLKYVFLTDYDRPENRDDVDGEGAIYDLAAKRVATYMSRGKCVAESSPGEELGDLQWRPASPHEAPPVPGILSLYNRGTRARWHWPCMHCGEFFEAKPGLGNFGLPPFEELEQLVQRSDLLTIASSFAHVACPHCGGLHEMQHRRDLNVRGRWVHEGETIRRDGTKEGERRGTQIASFWQGGVSATYQRWDHMLLSFLQGVLTYVRSGDERALKATTIQDQAAVYVSRAAAKRRTAEEYMSRVEDWPQGTVPEGVKYLVVAIDVQANRFEVLVEGWGVAQECWIVDRFKVTSSRRPEGPRTAALAPGSYLEDWDVILDEVLPKVYPRATDPTRALRVKVALCDSGGQEGVTTNAYSFWRKCKFVGAGNRFLLVKGHDRQEAPRVQQTWPDTRGRKTRHAGAQGDVPVWQLNVNVLKDAIAGELSRMQPGPGFVHFPRWLDAEFYDELTAEIRGARRWEKKQGAPNHAWDLHTYCRAAVIMLRAESIDWTRPPSWIAAEEIQVDGSGPPTKPLAPVRSISDLARSLNG